MGGVRDRYNRRRLLTAGMRADDLPLYDFGGRRPMASAVHYLGYKRYVREVRPVLNAPGAHALTENKWVFYRLADAAGLPIPRTFGLYDPVFGRGWDGAPFCTPEQVLAVLEGAAPGGVVVKPAGGQQGYDVTVLRDVDVHTGKATTLTGEAVELDAFFRSLPMAGRRGYRGWVVQEVVEQHPCLAELNPHTANTLRVMTLLLSSGEVVAQAAVLRLGRRGRMTDNWQQGGVAVPVSEDGRLTVGFLKPKHGGASVSAHPDTGVRLDGRHLPRYAEAVEVCRRGALAFPAVRWIGWDVLLSGDGPVVLEANQNFDLQIMQAATGGVFCDQVFRAETERLGLATPRRLPGPAEVSKAWARARARAIAAQARRRVDSMTRGPSRSVRRIILRQPPRS